LSSAHPRLLRAVRLLDEAVRIGRGTEEDRTLPEEAEAPETPPLDPREARLAETEARVLALDGMLAEERARAEAERARAEAALRSLRDEVAAEKAEIASEADRIREEARRKGHEEGFAEGKREGEAQARAEQEAAYRARFDGLVALLERTLAALDASREALISLHEPQMIRIWQVLLSRMLAERVRLDPGTVRRVLADLLRRLADRERVLIYLHPEDLAQVRGHPDLVDLLRGVKRLEYVADPHVDPGSALVETNLGVYDARWRTMLERIAEEVEGLLRAGEAERDDGDASE